MKRSAINAHLRAGDEYIRSFGYVLPPFAYLSPAELKGCIADRPALRDARLGWDLTDYGEGNFDDMGLFLFTVRNGSLADLRAGQGMCYAEKIMISRHDQLSPMHRHIVKAEDIINRGGAKLAIRMFESDAEGHIDRNCAVTVQVDGRVHTQGPGEVLELSPGESVTLMPGNWHAFWGEGGDVLIGEVSTVNDDLTDNVFEQPISRFGTVEEDEEPVWLMVSDYDTWL